MRHVGRMWSMCCSLLLLFWVPLCLSASHSARSWRCNTSRQAASHPACTPPGTRCPLVCCTSQTPQVCCCRACCKPNPAAGARTPHAHVGPPARRHPRPPLVCRHRELLQTFTKACVALNLVHLIPSLLFGVGIVETARGHQPAGQGPAGQAGSPGWGSQQVAPPAQDDGLVSGFQDL
eukprot:1153435-Pelagomonas_calceolata.AAC.3